MKPKKPASRYQQIANDIQEQIKTGELQDGDRLQSEREMSADLGVNRLTVRRAFNLLVERGLVNRRHGGGTYVTTPRVERRAGELVPFTLAIREMGMEPGARLIRFEQETADLSIANVLNIPEATPIYHIFRVRTINGDPAMLEQFFVSAALFPYFEAHDHETRSGYEIMETEYGISAVQAEQSLEPVVATTYEAELLGIAPGAPLMLERRLSLDAKGQPVEYGKDLYRGDTFKFVTSRAKLALSYSQPKS